MPLIAISYTPQPGSDEDVTQLNANFAQILALINGQLDADNVLTIAPPAALTGAVDSEGVLAGLSRGDHAHIIQGVEQLTADPSTGNFLGRVYTNTATGKLRYCANPAGAGVFVTIGNQGATDVAVHAAEHKVGGHDPLADNTLTDAMKAARTIHSATLAADVGPLSASTWTTVVDLVVTTKNIQTVDCLLNVAALNGSGSNAPVVALRVLDHTDADVTVYRDPCSEQMGINGGGSDQKVLSRRFRYQSPGDGNHTLRVQANASLSGVTIKKVATINTDTFVPPTIEAVIV